MKPPGSSEGHGIFYLCILLWKGDRGSASVDLLTTGDNFSTVI